MGGKTKSGFYYIAFGRQNVEVDSFIIFFLGNRKRYIEEIILEYRSKKCVAKIRATPGRELLVFIIKIGPKFRPSH